MSALWLNVYGFQERARCHPLIDWEVGTYSSGIPRVNNVYKPMDRVDTFCGGGNYSATWHPDRDSRAEELDSRKWLANRKLTAQGTWPKCSCATKLYIQLLSVPCESSLASRTHRR